MFRSLTVSFVSALLFGAGHAALASNACTMTFKSTSLVTGAGPTAIVTGDFNSDGSLDFAVADVGNTVSVFLGNGDGTFGSMATFPAGGNPRSITAADFNDDGKTDLAIAIKGGYVSVLIGKGGGTFKRSRYVTGKYPVAVTAMDLNGDKNIDLATTNTSSLSVLLNKGDGTFAAHSDYPAGGYVIATGKINGDKYPDLVVAELNSMSILPGNGDGTFGTAQTFDTDGRYTMGVATGAFHGQKAKDDVIVSNSDVNDANFFQNKGCR